jgi:hypothetical protein
MRRGGASQSETFDNVLKNPQFEEAIKQGHSKKGIDFLNAFTGRGLTVEDSTGQGSVDSTGAFNLQSSNPKGFGMTLDPFNKSASIHRGNFELSGGWGTAPMTGATQGVGPNSYIDQTGSQASLPSPGNWIQVGFNSKGFNSNQTKNAPTNMQRFLNEKSTDNVNTNQKQYNDTQDEINNMRLPQARYW